VRVRLGFSGLVPAVLLGALLVPHVRALGGGTHSANENAARVPVLVELFTSEGCSDCPPADSLLERLDKSQPVRDTELIVLSEHVDYWDGIGWRDPYSSHEYSERQGAFAGYFGLGTVYTPQMVVDGRFEFVGSDERRAIQAIETAAKVEKIPVSLSSVRLEGANMVSLHVETGPLPSAVESGSANVLLAVADESDQSQVSGGENAGRTLRHVAVVRTLIPVGTISKTEAFSGDVRINLKSGNSRSVRLVAFAQDQADGKIWGAGSARISK
jgi:hypothetical protein